ncbi:hypothetical protein DFH11DRAFT_1633216 [Phellopilus nigrolimitatus]|nr:hypothetical protein DFH11DRAFT_1633216 [Phellopilus nigrolimitatus]
MSVSASSPSGQDGSKKSDASPNPGLIRPDLLDAGMTCADAPAAASQARRLPSLQIPPRKELPFECDSDFPRSTSATSSLDPYYFSVPSRNDSPVPPLPDGNGEPELRLFRDPVTPARDPASIDRNGLFGVGELLTPRWPNAFPPFRNEDDLTLALAGDSEDGKPLAEDVKDASDDDDRDSPWTIEAVDGEPEQFEDTMDDASEREWKTRTHRSMADESGGEEILYPRKTLLIEISKEALPVLPGHEGSRAVRESPSPSVPTSPPSSFLSPTRKAKKRSSDEFAFDQSGFLIPKVSANDANSSLQNHAKDEKQALRKHHSLALSSTTAAALPREKKRGGSVRMSIGSVTKSGLTQPRSSKHARQQSAGSTSSTPGDLGRRGPETNSISSSPSAASSQPRRVAGPSVRLSSEKLSLMREKELHSSPSVAHSLLRGTQEGWSALDDDATAEALRKLDGISGKGARTRGSVGPASRSSNHSRPGTPGASRGHRSEGAEGSDRLSRRISSTGTHGRVKDRTRPDSTVISDKEIRVYGLDQSSQPDTGSKSLTTVEGSPLIKSSDGQLAATITLESDSKKPGSSARLSFTAKRNSASSTNYTGTPTSSSRDSAILSATSVTSASVTSSRFSLVKARRNSAGSDISSVHSGEATSQRDRVASLLTGEVTDGDPVPPVPPLPKDLSSYRTPPQSSASLVFPASDSTPDNGKEVDREASDRAASLEAPRIDHSLGFPTLSNNQGHEMPDKSVAPTILKTPSKKWSFTNPLNLRRSASPNRRDSSVLKSSSGLAPHSAMSKKQGHSSSSKDSPLLPTISPKSSVEAWQSIQRGAMASETSLASLSSLSSLPAPSPSISPSQPFGGMPTTRSHERDMPSRAGTTSSVSTNHAFLEIRPGQKSPSPSAPRESNNKRLTPSSIPFFRRSSSQSMQIPPSSATTAMSMSPTFSSAPNIQHTPGPRTDISPPKDSLVMSPSTPGSSQRKSSMLSLGLPSLLKGSSSRKSLQVEKGGANGKKHKESDNESTKNKKDDKDRSESRISVLMGRKRGKTLSSTDQKKIKPIALPPMQIAAIPPATAERLAQVGSTVSSSSSSPSRNPTSASSRATSQTISSMQKQSDASLRSSRQQLPTIAGSPSVGVHGINSHRSQSREQKEHHASAYASAISSVTKETPTRIPRIASRSSTVTSPQLKGSSSLLASRRTSLNLGTLGPQSESSVVGGDESMNEFGVLDYMEETISKSQNPSTTYRQSFRSSPSSSTKDVRQPLGLSAAISSSGGIPRKVAHDPVSAKGLRKLSTGSVASMASAAGLDQNHVPTLSPSKGSPSKGLNKLLSPKMTLPGSRLSSSSTAPNIFHHQTSGSPTSRCQPLSTPSPIPSSVDEDELLGDEEMMQYIRRTQARKLAHGAKKEELDELLKFPEPLPPGRPSSPATILSNERSPHLSDYERKEILDYPFVYYFGNKNDKKPASRDVSTNNYGYDDDRGDYQVINHDHLAYRYEIIDTLGKGSFGQVLHCRDHCSGESVAIKIIRNKKRFHHQALVEIKILENLRKWDPEEKHFVIKMTEHFYFRNHLCIAMELLSINLYELIKANGFAGFSTTLIRRFTSQMLLSLSLMRHHRIVHCDLKPENVLLRHPAKSGIKVIDFGSSCLEHEKVYTYIQSRFYRSPEVILGLNYNMAIDMWSLGCILAELYTGYPIFPGENEQEQLSCIMEVLGVPDKDLVNRSSRKRLFFDSTGAPRPVVNSKGRRRRAGTKTLAQVLRCDDELFVDFVSKCLAWDPERRIKPQSAMRHPFVTAGRRAKIVNNTTPSSSRGHLSSSSLLNVGRNKPTETPKKSQIGAPTPLAARSARAPTTQIPSTPIGSLAHPAQGSSKSFRTSQAPYHSSRSMNGFAIATAK